MAALSDAMMQVLLTLAAYYPFTLLAVGSGIVAGVVCLVLTGSF